MRVIVDTNIWSLALRRSRKRLTNRERRLVYKLREMIIDGDALLLGVVRQELLSGIKDAASFEAIRQYLEAFDDEPPTVADYERAATFSNRCSTAGIASSTVDMLLCSVAAGRGLPILSDDQDFQHYSIHLPIQMHT